MWEWVTYVALCCGPHHAELLFAGRAGGVWWKSGNPGSSEQDAGENESLVKVTMVVDFLPPLALNGSPQIRAQRAWTAFPVCTVSPSMEAAAC